MKSPKPPNLSDKSLKPNFFYGHRKPSRNRPVVYGGLFSNRQSLSQDSPKPQSNSVADRTTFDLRKWDPETRLPSERAPPWSPPSTVISAASERLSPIARFVLDALRKNQNHWGPSVVSELNKLRRVTPSRGSENRERRCSRGEVLPLGRIMDALMKNGYFDLALAVYEDFKEDGLVEESTTFMILVKGLCKAGRIEEMLEILQRMRDNLCKPHVFAYTAMIKTLVSEGNLDASLRVWDEIKPDVMAYGTLVMGLCRDGRVERGHELFVEMKEKQILIDRDIYRVLIEGFVRDGKVDKAFKLFQIAVEEELEPDFETLSPIMVGYVVMMRLSDFLSLVERIGNLGYPVGDYVTEIDEKKRAMALDVFDVLKSNGHASVSVYNLLMEALYKIGDVQKSLSLFSEMKGFGFEPDSSSYSIAICCFVEKGEVEEACSCHEKITDMSCVPSIAAYLSLNKGLSQIGEIDAVMIIVRECLGNVESGPMEFKYALRVCHVCKGSSNAEKVIEVVDEMKQQVVSINEVTYSAIIFGMCKHGTIKAAREVFAELKKRKVMTEAETVVYDEMLVEETKKKTADLVVSGIKFFGLESKLRERGCKLL
ncbi:unnamed protein product [Microthlaspi erraticum]|uniref:Pentacotripeptide-repeat region of PRORP domain-containing protein n=1 Tax=Microthlaspi erraticum TaxID=1685480 RepID=A0A6D2HUJ7_9BRAS|nr:unnamed protein product [Microthlaspi erraticum]